MDYFNNRIDQMTNLIRRVGRESTLGPNELPDTGKHINQIYSNMNKISDHYVRLNDVLH